MSTPVWLLASSGGSARGSRISALVCAAFVPLALIAVGGAAGAAPISKDPFVSTGPGSSPRSVAIGADGGFFTANLGTNSVAAFGSDGTPDPSKSIAMGAGSSPIDVAIDSTGRVWTANVGAHSIGSFVPGATTPTLFDLGVGVAPSAVAVGPNDIVYSANGTSNTVSKVERVGTVFVTTSTFGKLAAGSEPIALVTDAAGVVYTANAGNSAVSRILVDGTVTDVVAQLPVGGHPDAIAIDSRGLLYIADTDHDSVVKVDPTKPTASSIVATYPLESGSKPFGLAVDARDNVYVTERATSAVSVIPAAATAATVIQRMPVGSGVSGVAVSPDNMLLTTSFARGVVSLLDLKTAIALTTPVLGATVGTPVSGALTATGVDPVTFVSTDAPSWLTLDKTTGVFSGTPPAPGAVSFTVRGVSPVSESTQLSVSFVVAGVAPTTTPSPTPPPSPGTGSGGGSGAGTGAGGGTGTGAGTGTTGGAGGATGTLAHTGSDQSAFLLGGTGAVLLSAMGLLAVTRRRRPSVRR